MSGQEPDSTLGYDRQSPEPAVVEIVEDAPRGPGPGTAGLIKPNCVRINGQPLLIPHGEAITVHGMTLNSGESADDLVKVTLTLWARRVFMGHIAESPEQPHQ